MNFGQHFDYKTFKVKSAPPSVYYIPNFITPEDEAYLLKNVYSVPKPKWTCLSNRRLQDYGGVPHRNGMISEPIPKWLAKYMKTIDNLNVFAGKESNHVLINEYCAGQGIMPHGDGPLFHPTVTTISCGSHTILEFELDTNKDQSSEANSFQLLLERCSLLILQDDLYSKYLHSISERTCDIISDKVANLDLCCKGFSCNETLERDTRISVTIRNVPKIAKIKLWR